MKIPSRIVTRKFSPGLCLLIALLFFALTPRSSQAAVSSYRLSTTTGSYISTAGGTTLFSAYPGCRTYNVSYGVMNIGFNFVFDGVTYTQLQAYCSGLVTLGNSTMSSNYNNIIGTTTYAVLAPFWDQLWHCGGGNGMCANPYVRYKLIGSAPSRSLVIEWFNMETVAYTVALAQFELRIYEGTNRIEFYYGTMQNQATCGYCNGCSGSTSASIGLANGANNFISATPSGGTGATYSSSTANNSVNLASTKITAGTMYVWTNVPNVQLSATPKSFDVGSVPTGNYSDMNVVVTNAGTAGKMKVNSATLAGDPDFSVISTLPDSLAVGQTANITVRFAPTVNGPRSAVLTITSNGLDSGTQTISFKGIGLAPLAALDTNILFKKTLTKMGQSQTQHFNVLSTGVPTLIITGYFFTGADSDQYAITRFPNPAIPGGQKDSVFVTYTPTREGRHTAILNINNTSFNAPVLQVNLIGTGILPHIVVTPNPMVFDSTALGDSVCKTLSIYNPGSDTLLILSNLQSSGEGDFLYYPLTGTDTVIPPDKTRLVNICFKPKQAGTREGKIVLRTNIINTFEQPRRDTASEVIIPLEGSAVAYGGLSLSASTTNILDSAIVGTQVCINDTVRNIGGADVVIKTLSVSGANAAEFSVTGVQLPYTLKVGSYVILHVCTTPSQRGIRTATLTINGTSSGKTVGTSANLNTLGLLTCLSPSPTALFNGVQLYRGSDSTICDTVTNCGDLAAVYTATISGASASDYTVTPGTSQTVAPGATAVFCVQYHPAVTGSSIATMTISAPNTPSQTVSLGGSACCAHLTNDAFTIPATNAGGHGSFTVTINNTGGCDWNSGDPVIVGDTAVFHIGQVGTIAGNGNKQVTITYDPIDINHTYTASLSFPNGGPCQEDTLSMTLAQQTGPLSVSEQTDKDGYVLTQNRPNPFAMTTTFSYSVPSESPITLTLNDMTGKLVRTITSGRVSAGEHTVVLDANQLSSGTYVLTLRAANTVLSREIVIAK